MANEIKYQHPSEPSLTWSGFGRQPKWVKAFLDNGHRLFELELAAKEAASADNEIDLGINEGAAAPTLAEKLYAGRIAAGQAAMPDAASPSFTAGVRQALAEVGVTGGEVIDASGQTGALERKVEQPEASQQQLEVCLREFGFSAMTAQEFIQAGVDYINQATVYACRAGVAFWAAQEALKTDSDSSTPGRTQTFEDWIETAGLTKPRVYECIRIAKFYSRLPEDNRAKALTIGKKHALLLASLPQEVIDQAAESGNDLIGKADMMTVAQLKEEIKALQRRERNYEAELERAQGQVNRLLAAKSRTTDFLLRTEEIREECMALQLGAELNLNSLQKMFEAVRAEDPSVPEWKLQIEQIWVTAHVVASRALDLVERMKDNVRDGEMPERIMGQHILSPAEAQRWLLDYPMIENRYAAEQATRQEKREAARPKGPGRPKGSANKGGEE